MPCWRWLWRTPRHPPSPQLPPLPVCPHPLGSLEGDLATTTTPPPATGFYVRLNTILRMCTFSFVITFRRKEGLGTLGLTN